jgi:hypothetical protein
MLGLIKIGKTSKDPESRAKELNQTGTPSPFIVSYFALVSNMDEVEQLMHEKFDEYRENNRREFFRISAKLAIDELKVFENEYKQESPIGITSKTQTGIFIAKISEKHQTSNPNVNSQISIPWSYIENKSIVNFNRNLFNTLWKTTFLLKSDELTIYKIGTCNTNSEETNSRLRKFISEISIDNANIETIFFQNINCQIDINEFLSNYAHHCISTKLGLVFTDKKGIENIWSKFQSYALERVIINQPIAPDEPQGLSKEKINELNNFFD